MSSRDVLISTGQNSVPGATGQFVRCQRAPSVAAAAAVQACVALDSCPRIVEATDAGTCRRRIRRRRPDCGPGPWRWYEFCHAPLVEEERHVGLRDPRAAAPSPSCKLDQFDLLFAIGACARRRATNPASPVELRCPRRAARELVAAGCPRRAPSPIRGTSSRGSAKPPAVKP